MRWHATKYLFRFIVMKYHYDINFVIESCIDEKNKITFSIKTDKDSEFLTFDLSQIEQLVLHIKKHLESRQSLSTQYQHQLSRVDALLGTLGHPSR